MHASLQKGPLKLHREFGGEKPTFKLNLRRRYALHTLFQYSNGFDMENPDFRTRISRIASLQRQ